jgi:phage terminase large subunit GpA-like protein
MPHLAGIMDAITDPAVSEIWCMKSKQTGWSEVLLNTIGYFADVDPSPQMLIQPTLEAGEGFSKDRVAPMIRDTPSLRGKVADPRSRDSGNTLRHKQYPGGYLTIQGANSPSGLASRPLRVLECDEVDKYPATAGASGDPISLARDRLQTFWNRKMLAGSTPTIKGQSRVEAGFMSSDQRFAFYPCPHCGEYQRLVWTQVKWTEFELPPKRAVYQCKACGKPISEGQRRAMLQKIEWRASRTFNGVAGFHINELMSPFSSLGEMAEAFVEAKKLPETLQAFINERLAETWEDTARSIEPEGLLARREQYGAELLPADVMMLTIGVDTQDDRLEVQLVGWGRDEESWILEHDVIRGDPGAHKVWNDLTLYRRRKFATEDGRAMRIQAAAVDAGGHYSQQVFNYCYRFRFARVFAIMGKGGVGRLAWPRKPGKTKLSKADVYHIGVDTIKDLLYGRMAKISPPERGEPRPGYIHLPSTIDQDFVDQLVSETKVYKTSGGRRVAMWRPKRAGVRQEAQDCWIYAYAAMIGRGGEKLVNSIADALEQRGRAKKPPPPTSTPPVAEQSSPPALPSSPPETTPPRPEDPPPTPTPPATPPPAAPPRRKKPRFRVFRSNYLRK